MENVIAAIGVRDEADAGMSIVVRLTPEGRRLAIAGLALGLDWFNWIGDGVEDAFIELSAGVQEFGEEHGASEVQRLVTEFERSTSGDAEGSSSPH